MSFKIGGRPGEPDAASMVEHGSHGGLFATVLSGVALIISGLSYYESTLRSAELSVYVPPMIHYARDGDADVFNIPITIANDGAKNGTVLSMELDVDNLRADAERKNGRFHSAFLGDYPRDDKVPNRSFAPLSIPGHGTFTETVRFYPMDDARGFVVDDKGDYRFTLTLSVARPPEASVIGRLFGRAPPRPLVFELNLPYLAVQHLSFRNGTQAMFNKDWKPATAFSAPSDLSAPEPSSDSGSGPSPADGSPQAGSAAESSGKAPASPPEAAPPPPAPPPAAPPKNNTQKIEIIPETPKAPPPAAPKSPANGAGKTATQPQR